ncbi:MAG TPA: SRPBCC family protein [Armatimonadota bacterium]|nr:SRPBCC family protein [Armatimonadota bacterium]
MAETVKWYRDEASGQYIFDAFVMVNAPVDVCFNAWSNFESFPRLMSYVQEVRHEGDNTWHWEATVGGVRAKWEAKTTEFRKDEVISWESIRGLRNSGSVYFSKENRGCRVAVHLAYDPPYGAIGDVVAERRINDQFASNLQHDLDNFKQHVESGDIGYFRRAA